MSTDTIFGFPVQVCDTLPYDNIRLVSDGKVLRLINVQDPHFKQEGAMNKEETMERKETVAERFHISDERGFVERLASLALSDGFEAEQIRNIRSIAQHLLKNRAASAPEAAGRSEDGAALIAAERQRQIEVEGWTTAHDDKHNNGEIAAAASTYVLFVCDQVDREFVTDRDFTRRSQQRHDAGWPWDAKWWKPSVDPIQNLVKAGALIAAEIDRLRRQSAPPSGERVTSETAHHNA